MAENQQIQTRLIQAGIELLDRGHAPASLSPQAVAEAAQLLVADFTACYPSSEAYLAGLIQWFLDELRDTANQATDAMPRNMARLKHGIDAYLDHGLRRPGLRELILSLQNQTEAMRMHRNRVKGWIFFFQIEFAALGVERARERSQLCIGMASHIALTEYEARSIQRDLRETLHAYMDHLQP